MKIRVGCLIRLEGLRASTIQGGRHRMERAQPKVVEGRQAVRQDQSPDAEGIIASLDS